MCPPKFKFKFKFKFEFKFKSSQITAHVQNAENGGFCYSTHSSWT